VHITGTAYRGEFGVSQGIDPIIWIVPTTPVDLTVSLDDGSPIGTATLTQAADGTITVDAQVDEVYRRWTHTRAYLAVELDGGDPDTVLFAGIVIDTEDPDLPPWTEVVD
jgi:hypothetical protein